MLLDDRWKQDVVESFWESGDGSAMCPVCGADLPADEQPEVTDFGPAHATVICDLGCPECGWALGLEVSLSMQRGKGVSIRDMWETD